MAAPVETRIRTKLVRTRPRDTLGALPVVIVIGQAPPGPPDTSPGYTRVYLTRVRRTRGRRAYSKLGTPRIIAAAAQPPTARIRITLVKTRPRRTQRGVGPPRVVAVPPVVLQRDVRSRRWLVKTRPRKTIWHVVKPVQVGPFTPPVPPVTPTRTRIQTTLGCGDYACYLMERGGGTFVGEIPWTTLHWTRALDDTSQASVTGDVGACSDVFTAAMPWQHELVIFRSGDQVWCGPVYTVTGDPSTPQIVARDLSAWWDHRIIHHDHDYSQVPADLAVIFQAVHEDAMNADNTPGLVVETVPTGIDGRQKVLAAQRQQAGPFLRDLAQAGVDWTVIGRTAYAGGIIVPGVRVAGIITDEHFSTPPTPIRDGSNQGNKQYILGQSTDNSGNPIEGVAADADLQVEDGLLESVESVSTITDAATAAASAASKLALNDRPVAISQGVLGPNAPATMAELVPGRIITIVLRETVVRVQGQYRIGGLEVNADSRGGESVQLVLQVPGTGDG